MKIKIKTKLLSNKKEKKQKIASTDTQKTKKIILNKIKKKSRVQEKQKRIKGEEKYKTIFKK